MYVANRVHRIKDLVGSDERHYVNTASNPADIASRGLSVEKLIESSWFSGPTFMRDHDLLSVML